MYVRKREKEKTNTVICSWCFNKGHNIPSGKREQCGICAKIAHDVTVLSFPSKQRLMKNHEHR